MAILVNVSIDLTKIDKSKIVNGQRGGKYLPLLVALNDAFDSFGNNVAVSIGQSKQEHETGEKKIYLGNGRITWRNDGVAVQRPPQQPAATPAPVQQPVQQPYRDPNDGLPF